MELKIERDSHEANVRYVRSPRQWVKITRNAESKTFHFARGYTGEVMAHDRNTRSFLFCSTWTDAINLAEQAIKDYE